MTKTSSLLGADGRPSFKNIPSFTRSAPYVVDCPWEYIEDTLERYGRVEMNGKSVLQLDPEFQRAHVWDDAKRIRYVEYVLRGGKSSRDIYFNQADWMRTWKAPMYLVDGKQRLEAVRKFMASELPVFGGYVYSEFSDRMNHEPSFKFHVNDLRTYPEVLRWYLDLNEGGVAHTEQELAKVRSMLIEALQPAPKP